MTDLWTAYASAFVLGAAHAVEVDHMVAVTAFVGGRPRLARAAGFGLRWGVGHAAVVLLAGVSLAATGIAVPARFESAMEIGVGLMLVALGVWAHRRAGRFHVHDPATHSGEFAHAHLHAHDPSAHPHDHAGRNPRRHHRHLPTIIGAVHGLAGAAPVLVLLPVTLIESPAAAVGYLGVFGIGTVLAMTLYAGAAAWAVAHAETLRAVRTVGAVTAAASVVVGVIWVLRGVTAL